MTFEWIPINLPHQKIWEEHHLLISYPSAAAHLRRLAELLWAMNKHVSFSDNTEPRMYHRWLAHFASFTHSFTSWVVLNDLGLIAVNMPLMAAVGFITQLQKYLFSFSLLWVSPHAYSCVHICMQRLNVTYLRLFNLKVKESDSCYLLDWSKHLFSWQNKAILQSAVNDGYILRTMIPIRVL